MSSGIRIRKALVADLDRLKDLRPRSGPDPALDYRVTDGCVLMAEDTHGLRASAGVDLETARIQGLWIDPSLMSEELGPKLIRATEKLAAGFGILGLTINSTPQFSGLLQSCGYASAGPHPDPDKIMQRSFPRRGTRYLKSVNGVLSDLGIPLDYGRIHRIPLQTEARNLRSIGMDIYQREQKMLPRAAIAWNKMTEEASREAVRIQVVSAFRSVSYQAGLVRKKIDKGLSIEAILKVSAAPGYSEHHTGRAVDVATPGFPILEELFDSSPAFQWLQARAADFDFHMSFPQGNRHGLSYEPWHWSWSG